MIIKHHHASIFHSNRQFSPLTEVIFNFQYNSEEPSGSFVKGVFIAANTVIGILPCMESSKFVGLQSFQRILFLKSKVTSTVVF
jgi:hypothetical protein